MSPKKEIKVDPDIEDLLRAVETGDDGKFYQLILFNDDTHDMAQVCLQIIKAINCDFPRAKHLMLQTHIRGKTVLLKGSLPECKKAEAILNQINLKTEIEEIKADSLD
jgi:ATP-dependent Clp protease adapter protein ClpS